jgi:hypothetical protein
MQAGSERRGELLTLRRMLVNIVKKRFPALTELAQQRAEKIDKPDVLGLLVEQVATASDENMVRWLLDPQAA